MFLMLGLDFSELEIVLFESELVDRLLYKSSLTHSHKDAQVAG